MEFLNNMHEYCFLCCSVIMVFDGRNVNLILRSRHIAPFWRLLMSLDHTKSMAGINTRIPIQYANIIQSKLTIIIIIITDNCPFFVCCVCVPSNVGHTTLTWMRTRDMTVVRQIVSRTFLHIYILVYKKSQSKKCVCVLSWRNIKVNHFRPVCRSHKHIVYMNECFSYATKMRTTQHEFVIQKSKIIKCQFLNSECVSTCQRVFFFRNGQNRDPNCAGLFTCDALNIFFFSIIQRDKRTWFQFHAIHTANW